MSMKMVYFHKNDGRVGNDDWGGGNASRRDCPDCERPSDSNSPYVHNMMVWQIMTLGTPFD